MEYPVALNNLLDMYHRNHIRVTAIKSKLGYDNFVHIVASDYTSVLAQVIELIPVRTCLSLLGVVRSYKCRCILMYRITGIAPSYVDFMTIPVSSG